MVKILYALCICLRIADVRGSTFATSSQRSSHWSPGVGSSRNVDHSNAPLAYEATVTTEMNYYATDSYTSKSEKKRSHHAEYEYVGAGGYAAHGIELPKSGKKGGYYDPHYTIEPTDYDDTVVPTYYPKSSKSGKKENIHSQEPTHAPTYWGTGYHDGKGSKSKGYSSKKSGISKKSSKKGGPKDGHIPEYTHRKLYVY